MIFANVEHPVYLWIGCEGVRDTCLECAIRFVVLTTSLCLLFRRLLLAPDMGTAAGTYNDGLASVVCWGNPVAVFLHFFWVVSSVCRRVATRR